MLLNEPLKLKTIFRLHALIKGVVRFHDWLIFQYLVTSGQGEIWACIWGCLFVISRLWKGKKKRKENSLLLSISVAILKYELLTWKWVQLWRCPRSGGAARYYTECLHQNNCNRPLNLARWEKQCFRVWAQGFLFRNASRPSLWWGLNCCVTFITALPVARLWTLHRGGPGGIFFKTFPRTCRRPASTLYLTANKVASWHPVLSVWLFF